MLMIRVIVCAVRVVLMSVVLSVFGLFCHFSILFFILSTLCVLRASLENLAGRRGSRRIRHR
jgi:hypothetical protein